MENIGLVLEGGGTRGVFTAGVLDYFMERNLRFPYVIGVSAGACNGISYVANQKGRSRACMIDCIGTNDYVNVKLKNIIKSRSIFDMDLLFDTFPNKLIPFNYYTYFNTEQRCIVTATNCITGQAEYLEERNSKDRLMKICRASSSLPYMSPFVYVDNIPMLDGGIADSIPIKKAISDGCTRNVLILTRGEGYRKVEKHNRLITKLRYRDYPNLNKAIMNRNEVYNQTLDYIDKIEKEGKAFIIRPQGEITVGRAERSKEKLTEFYNDGYKYAALIYDDLVKWTKGN